MKSCRPSGTRPVKSAANQAMMTTMNATIAVQAQHDHVRYQQEDPEEDRQARALEVVTADEPDRIGRVLMPSA